jgi:hypothetical protein
MVSSSDKDVVQPGPAVETGLGLYTPPGPQGSGTGPGFSCTRTHLSTFMYTPNDPKFLLTTSSLTKNHAHQSNNHKFKFERHKQPSLARPLKLLSPRKKRGRVACGLLSRTLWIYVKSFCSFVSLNILWVKIFGCIWRTMCTTCFTKSECSFFSANVPL